MRFTPLFASSVSGSLGGLTAARGPRGHRLYGKRVKVRTDSQFQRAARQAFSWAKQGWFEIATEEDRQRWREHGKTLHVPDSLGVMRTVSGRGAYQMMDSQFLYVTALGGTLNLTPFPSARVPPGFGPPPVFSDVVVSRSGSGDDLNVSVQWHNGDQYGQFADFFIYASKPSNHPNSNCRKSYIFGTEFFTNPQPNPVFRFGSNGGLSWRNKYGSPVPGQWVGLKVVVYTFDFQFSRPFEFGPFQIQP